MAMTGLDGGPRGEETGEGEGALGLQGSQTDLL